ncbi:hypothetical protein SESBI_10703 [Sesbania bispinosa]|nr:hypothetical protein SESBI_10703 [Sesbania bispinosa]
MENIVSVKRMKGKKKIPDRASSKGKKKIVNGKSSKHSVDKNSVGSVKMSPELDKSTMARCITEKRKETAKVKYEQPAAGAGEIKSNEDSGRLDQSKVLRNENQILDQFVGSSKKRKRSKDVGSGEVHNISNDEQRSKNIVDVFQEFLGSTPEVRRCGILGSSSGI